MTSPSYRVALIEGDGIGPEIVAAARRVLAIEVPDLRATVAELKGKSVQFHSVIQEYGHIYLTKLEDPAGNRLQLGRTAHPARTLIRQVGKSTGLACCPARL